ncbi:unnamed protein product [Rotaria sp. Silwood2]|nr:unnamed protein product [Rotaria sp. Silwood2]CAF4789922.1 unnamed protein product [Rotaria sp. Silwood2]
MFISAAVFTLGSVENITSEDWDRVFAVNVKGGCALMVKAIVPLFKKQKSGSIINIASSLGLVAMNGVTPYSTSKGAIIQLTKNLALDLAPYNIRVNSISPGPVGEASTYIIFLK